MQQAGERARWQTRFGFRDEVDLLYEQHPPPRRPRLPAAEDAVTQWRQVVFPESPNELLGNEHAVELLQALLEGRQSVLCNFVISGGEGSGKKAYLRLLQKALPTTVGTEKKCAIMAFDAALLAEKELMDKMEDAAKKINITGSISFLIIDHFEVVPVAFQQHHLLPFVAVCNTKRIFAILCIRSDANKLPEQLRQRACHVHMQPLNNMQVRAKILLICKSQRIGFERPGLEALLAHVKFKLLPSIATLGQVFVSHQFVSVANVQKFINARVSNSASASAEPVSSPASVTAPTPFPLSIVSMNQPLRRCRLCTLLPPCSHVTVQNLFDRADRVRQLYPSREGSEASLCPSFARRGICANVQAIGRCRYAHPRHIHTIDTTALVKRCAVHTLPLPCDHCEHIIADKQSLQREQAALRRLQQEIGTTRKLLIAKETARYMFFREHSKSVKWGAARREYAEELAELDAEIRRIHDAVGTQEQEASERQLHIAQLTQNVTRGHSKGLGKGKGR